MSPKSRSFDGVRIVGELARTDHLLEGTMRFVRDYTVEVSRPDAVWRILVPEGLETDGSSVPRLLRSVFPKDRTRQAGFVHDSLYRRPVVREQPATAWDESKPHRSRTLKKRECDHVWGRVANAGYRRASLPRPLCWLGVLGLLIFGWFAWRKHRRRDGVEA